VPGIASDHTQVIGRALESLTLDQRYALANKWLAWQIYTPQTLPLRRIEAVGETQMECIQQLAARGVDPRECELEFCKPPF
jgi:hypothetical protein